MDILLIYAILLIVRWTSALAGEDVEYSITIHSVPKTISYQLAVSNCKADGKELCSSKTICKDGKIPYSGVVPGDHWVPVADDYNEWMQIGNFHRPCIFHSVGLGHKPIWGLKNIAQNYKGNLFCCKIKRKEDSVTIKAVSDSISYQQALMNCQTDGKELCTSKDICKDGKTPKGGPLPGDKWVPVKDSYNEWLQIGSSPNRPCILHTSLGFKARWGLGNTVRSYRSGLLFCCERKSPDTGFVLKSVSSSVTYNQSVLNCISNGKRLCNSKEICIDGKTPVSGAISGDHWVPINDDSNEWIQIGNSPNKPCSFHSKLYGKSDWGVKPISQPYKGYLFCCNI